MRAARSYSSNTGRQCANSTRRLTMRPRTKSVIPTMPPTGSTNPDSADVEGRDAARPVHRSPQTRTPSCWCGGYTRTRQSLFAAGSAHAVRSGINKIPRRSKPSHAAMTGRMHGSEAVRRFGFSARAPILPVFHVGALSRTIRIANIPCRTIPTSDRRRLQCGKDPGCRARRPPARRGLRSRPAFFLNARESR